MSKEKLPKKNVERIDNSAFDSNGKNYILFQLFDKEKNKCIGDESEDEREK
jgi:hypothetical protein